MGIFSKWKPMGKNKDGNTFMERTGPDGKEQFLEIQPDGKETLISGNKQTVVYDPSPPHASAPHASPPTDPVVQPLATPVDYHPAHTPPAAAGQSGTPPASTTESSQPDVKPDIKKDMVISDNDGHSYNVSQSSIDNFKIGGNGDLLERKADGDGWYVAEKTSKIATGGPVSENGFGMSGSMPAVEPPVKAAPATSFYTDTTSSAQMARQVAGAVPDINQVSENGQGQNGAAAQPHVATAPASSAPDFVSENGAAAQPHLTAAPKTLSEHGLGSGFASDNSPAAQPRPQETVAAPVAAVPAWHEDITSDLGGMGGSDLQEHGSALATRDSKDGKSVIAQMSDGSYESINKTTGAVSGAGTWGDGTGGGVAKNGISNNQPAADIKPNPPTPVAQTGPAFVDPVPQRPTVTASNTLTNFGVDTNAHSVGRNAMGRFLE